MSLRLGALRWRARLVQRGRAALGRRRPAVFVHQRVDEYRDYWREAAGWVGAEFVALSESIWEVRRDGKRTRIVNDLVQLDDPVTLSVAGDKVFCAQVARGLEIPVPEFVVCELSNLPRASRLFGRPLVVKPADGTSSGVGVTVAVETRAELERAAALASLHSRRIVVSEMVPAESCRLLYLDGELLHAVRRRGVRLTGDGRATIGALLERFGAGRVREDRMTRRTLAAQGLGVGSVLEAGRTIVARALPAGERRTRELRTVYDEDITGEVHPVLAAQMAALVRAVGSRFAGVDLLTNEPSVPLQESGGAFVEINTTPGLHHHYVGAEDRRRRPVAARALERLLSDGHPG